MIKNYTIEYMKNLSEIYKKPFFACFLCAIYAATSLGIALFDF